MAEFPALSLWTDAYLGDTRHLTTAQHGAYLLLLITAWRTKACALPDNDEILARYVCLDIRNWQKMKPIIMAFWQLGSDGLWRQGRLSDEREFAESRRQKSARAGHASALKRLGRHSTSVDPEFNSNSTSLIPTHYHTKKKETPPTPSNPKLFDAQLKTEFEEFYSIYPRKEARKHAEKAYNTARKGGASHAEIIAGAGKYAASVANTEPRFIKQPATWLNGGCWSDSPIPRQEPNGKSAYSDSIQRAADRAEAVIRDGEQFIREDDPDAKPF